MDADFGACLDHDARHDDRASPQFDIRIDTRKGMNHLNPVQLEIGGDSGPGGIVADGDHRQSVRLEREIPHRTDDLQTGRRAMQRIGIVVEKADRFPIPLRRRDVIRPGENFASEAAGADDI